MHFDSVDIPSTGNLGFLENATLARITYQYMQYPYFEQSLKMEAIDFFNQLGGALGLYIGCSFIALFHIIVYPTHMIMDCVEKRRRRRIVKAAMAKWAGEYGL
jgi:fucose permease